MDDLLTLHADRVGNSHEAHEAALEQARAEHEVGVAEAFQAFIVAMNEIMDKANAASGHLSARIGEIGARAIETARAAFAANLAEIAASGAAMQAEMREREAFLLTGKLPVVDPLPAAAPPPESDADPERTAA